MNMRTILFCLAGLVLTAHSQEPDYLTYAIPGDARKQGPKATRIPDEQECLYFPASGEMTRDNPLGIELLHRGTLVKRDLLKDGKKHGVQREWFPSGTIKSESPYKNGLMEGVYRVW